MGPRRSGFLSNEDFILASRLLYNDFLLWCFASRRLLRGRFCQFVGNRAGTWRVVVHQFKEVIMAGYLRRGFILVAAGIWVCAQVGAQPAGTQKVPDALVNVGEFGENIYDLAKGNDWVKVAEKFTALKGAVKDLPPTVKQSSTDQKRLTDNVAALGKAIPAKDQLGTMRAANQVTSVAADLTEPFKPKVPSTVTRLDFFGRELELGTMAKDQNQLKKGAEGLRQNWDKIRSDVKARGGEAEAKRFEALVTQAGAAKSVEDYSKVVKPILDEVDNLEKVFLK